MEMGRQSSLDFIGGQFPRGFADVLFGMNPARLHGVEPGTVLGQADDQQTHIALVLGLLVVSMDPGANPLADVPTGVIPQDDQHLFLLLTRDVQQRGHKAEGLLAVGLSLTESQIDLLGVLPDRAEDSPRLAFGIVFAPFAFNQPQGLTGQRPGMGSGLREAREPAFIFVQQQPVPASGGPRLHSVAPLFLTGYSSSGLFIQCLACFQRTPRRFSVRPMQSGSTVRRVSPSRASKSARYACVHRLSSYPNRRGDWRITSRSRSSPASSTPRRLLCGALDFGSRRPIPSTSKAQIAPRTHWSLHLSRSAISLAFRPSSLLISSIWQRRTLKADPERKPAFRAVFSSSVNGLAYS